MQRIAIACFDNRVDALLADVNASGKYRLLKATSRSIDDDQNVGEALAEIVNQWQCPTATASLVIARGEVEIRNLRFPPVPENELPDMVRLQAGRHFTSVTDQTVIDFVPLNRNDDGVSVLAAATTPKTVAEACGIAAAVGLEVDRVSFQSLASASLHRPVNESYPDVDLRSATVLHTIGNVVEVAVFIDDELRSIRTVRIPNINPADAIVAEIRRSRMSCGCTAECPVLFLGDPDDPTAVEIERHGLKVMAVDPLAIDGPRPEVTGETSAMQNGRYASLVGMIDAENGNVYGLNFLAPRKRLETKPDRRRQAILAMAAITAVVAALTAVYQTIASRDREIAAVQEQIDSMRDAIDDSSLVLSEVEQVESFLDADINWLNEVRRLSEMASPSDQFILSDLRGTANLRQGGGQLEYKGRVTEPSILGEMAAQIADEHREVVGNGASEAKSDDRYKWVFTQKVMIHSALVQENRLNLVGTQEADVNDDLKTLDSSTQPLEPESARGGKIAEQNEMAGRPVEEGGAS